jgi:GT2 family glycosyltransferase
MTAEGVGVSFVVPVRNGAAHLVDALSAILAEDDGRPFEVVVVDDGSTDASPEVIRRFTTDPRVRSLEGEGRGAAAAINLGWREARHPVVAQVDQDVILHRGWLRRLVDELDDPEVGAAQGHYVADPAATPLERVAGYELEMRYTAISGRFVDQACTGNSLYRAEAVRGVGGFDESLGYGYDNDMSYRLGRAGFRLAFCRQARSNHRWRQGLGPYLAQQYGLGYGRLEVIARHPGRVTGDQVSGLGMILHVPAMLAALALVVAAGGAALLGGPWQGLALPAAGLLGVLALERLVVAVRAAVRFADPAALLIVPAHLLRDVAWVAATLVWGARRLLRRPSRPWHSMGGR